MTPWGGACVAGAVVLLVASGAWSFAGGGPGTGTGSRADAGPASADTAAQWITVPTGWRPLADLVIEPPAAPPESAVRVESRSAHGDPAAGCFVLVQRLSVPAKGFDQGRAMAALLEQLKGAGWTAGPASDGELPFLGPGLQGRLRARVDPEAGDRTVVLSVACFYNDREPDRCRPTCEAILDSAGVRR